MIGSLVAQICTKIGSVPEELQKIYEHSVASSGQPSRPTTEALTSAMKTLATEHKLILLLDALDECNKPSSAAEALVKLACKDSGINVFITSRDESNIRQYLASTSQLSISSHGLEISRDIRQYIEQRLDLEAGFRWLKPHFRSEIEDLLHAKSGGM